MGRLRTQTRRRLGSGWHAGSVERCVPGSTWPSWERISRQSLLRRPACAWFCRFRRRTAPRLSAITRLAYPDRFPDQAHQHAQDGPEITPDWQFKHPEHGYRSCLGLLSLAKRYGAPRLEAACERALVLGTVKYRHVRDLLANNRDQLQNPDQSDWVSPTHANVRGPGYYQ